MDSLFILLFALAIDLGVGDPPTRFHPVGWMGKLIGALESLAPASAGKRQVLYGCFMVVLGAAVFTVPAYFLMDFLDDVNQMAHIGVGALLLKLTFSLTGISRSAARVRQFLLRHDRQSAREQLPALVSRDPEELNDEMMVAATVESVAENSSDSYVAPLFWFLVFGVPGAVAYRVVNTFDAMIGYHGRYEHLGRFAARMDDVLNWIPARLTGCLFVIAARLRRSDASSAWRIMCRDHARTESPNAGWPMSAAAGALGVLLEKRGHYRLGDGHHALSPAIIEAGLQLMWLVAMIWGLLCLGVEGVKFALAA